MKLLVIKTSSLGDILHAFPALTDAAGCVDGLVCDWVVEEAYAAMPAWHPAVRRVIPVSLRGWRRFPWHRHLPAIRRFRRDLRREEYDLVLDAQGLLKSAVLAAASRGRRAGFDGPSAKESVAARLYQDRVKVAAGGHAVDRNRELFAGALGYRVPDGMDYGLRLPATSPGVDEEPCIVFIPGTTWPSKRWPAAYWRSLAELVVAAGWRLRVLAGSDGERDLARKITSGLDGSGVLSGLSIDGLAHALRSARAVVSVDSGPGHLAAAVGTPGISVYGATDPALTGTRGAGQVHARADFDCAPCLRRRCVFADTGQVHPDCYATVPPIHVWSTLRDLISVERKL